MAGKNTNVWDTVVPVIIFGVLFWVYHETIATWWSGKVPRLVTIDSESVSVCGNVDIEQGWFADAYTVAYEDNNSHKHKVYGARTVKMDEQPSQVPAPLPANVSLVTSDKKPYQVGLVYSFTDGSKGMFAAYTVFKPETTTTASGGKWETVPEGRSETLPDGRIVTDTQWREVEQPNSICDKTTK